MTNQALDLFGPCTASWFSRSIGTPTTVQAEAWPAIASGRHTLVSAPTGTGKTLSAFLVYIDRLRAESRTGTLRSELQLIYVSPLKSLAGDIRENLRRPLSGIAHEEQVSGILQPHASFSLQVAIRTGDTPPNERRRMIKSPPHILITTPESLYLMLTSQSGAAMLRTARWIIIDELHALIDSKRGAHLMLSLARLDRLCPQPLQRVGLSATITPLELAAEYLAPDPVAIVSPKMTKQVELSVTSPFTGETAAGVRRNTWQEIAATVYARCAGTRSVIAFVEGRAYAEKLAYYVNQLAGGTFAQTHHGSMAKEQRAEVERALRDGAVRLLCATSSMELGIDVGEVDQVFQIGCPRTISGTMQRLGRAGHNPGRTSIMHIFPRTPAEALYSGLTAEVARQGGIEFCRPPRLCLDVLAQHLVSMAAGDGYTVDDVMPVLARAWPFRDITRDDVREVLRMLAGDYEHDRDKPVRPRVLYDRIHERVQGDPYSRMLAVSTGGTIPDRGLYAVRTEKGVRLGELDEEYVFEARIGDRFLLGAFAWQILSVQRDAVIVAQSSFGGARPPFWKGEIRGRRLQTGLAFGALFRQLGAACANDKLTDVLARLGLDAESAEGAGQLIKRQIAVTGVLPDDRTILIEHFRDENGSRPMMVHAVFGRPVNEPLAVLTAELARKLTNTYISYVDDDDGFLLFPYGESELPEGLFSRVSLETARSVLQARLPTTPLFNMAFRYNAARALMMGVRKAGRQPLWVQRLRGAEMLDALVAEDRHPLIRETRRECLEDFWDLPGVESILKGIRSGQVKVREIFTETPSPLSLTLRQQTEAAMMYDYAPTTPGIQHASEEALKQMPLIEPAPDLLARTSERRHLPEDANQLHTLLMIEGDLLAGELDIPVAWLEELARQERVKYIEPGLWIAAEQAGEYADALNGDDNSGRSDARLHLVRRLLRYRGAQTPVMLSERYFWTDDESRMILADLCRREKAVEQDGLFYHAELYSRARQETIQSRRRQVRTVPAEHYAALLAGRTIIAAPQEKRVESALRMLCGQAFPPEWWEGILLPARAGIYRPEQLDALLAQGKYFWQINSDRTLSFHLDEEINWEAGLPDPEQSLTELESRMREALLKRGASFMHRLADLTDGESPYDTLLSMAAKGLVHADSYAPVRQWLMQEKLEQMPVKQRARVRAQAMSAGHWEVSRPLLALSAAQELERAFDRAIILCRETASGLAWERALEILRVWEYTGQVRRGFFVEGLSGVQFIREKEYAGTLLTLEQPLDQIIWLNAADPAQSWGKTLAHRPDRSFIVVPGTAVALRAGAPAAVLERQGRLLRVFDPTSLTDILQILARMFAEKRIFPTLSRLTIREYPPEAAEALLAAGFVRSVQDYVLYRQL